MNRISGVALSMMVLGCPPAVAKPQAAYELRCNSERHGAVRGGPWARVGGPFHSIATCEKAMPEHRRVAHGGDLSVVLQCLEVG